MSEQWLWLILLFPLAGAATAGLLGPKFLKQNAHWPVTAGVALAFLVSLWGLLTLQGTHGEAVQLATGPLTWFRAGDVNIQAGLVLDPLSAVMLMAITGIGTWIAVYSVGYMHGDAGLPRYFAVLGLFVVAMCLLVLADNLLLLYAGWEGVGLCSYLLIGFWFTRPAAAAAARKAFLVTRIGDAGLVLGIFLLWRVCDHKLDFTHLFAFATTLDEPTVTIACLLLFVGCVGKSAQFPLHVWLPDAMEGPTPASALIHAATMVTAGVYLIARCMPLFALAPNAQLAVAGIGGVTALLAALIALTQHDLKRVMAYSTVSQLGYMFLGLGAGRGNLAVFAATAAIFHLFTHAFFKALLFLASGSVMHAMGHVIDMRRIGGLRKVMPVTHITFAVGAAALAGLPPLSGFWSKDEIIAAVHSAEHVVPHGQAWVYQVLFGMALLTAFLTAFYTGRAYFRTFWGELKVPPEAGSHHHDEDDDHGHDDHHGHADAHAHNHQPAGPGVAHESPLVMTVPLMVLAVGALLVGGLLGPATHWFPHFLGRVPTYVRLPEGHEHGMDYTLLAISSALALGGLAVAWLFYVAKPGIPDAIARTAPAVVEASRNRFYFDELYRALVVLPASALATVASFVDGLIDGLVDLVGRVPRWAAHLARPIQNGLVQFYALAMVLGLAMFIGILTLRR